MSESAASTAVTRRSVMLSMAALALGSGAGAAGDPPPRPQPRASPSAARAARARRRRRDCATGLVLGMVVGSGIFCPTPLGAQSFAGAVRVVERAVRDRVFPGAVLVIGRRDTILLARGFGHLTWDPASAVPTPGGTRWDLASLTKVLGTTGVAARLAARGALDVEAPVARYLPCWRGGARDGVTVRQLLTHRSGLRPSLPLWRDTPSADSAFARTCGEVQRAAPGDSTIYSDLNFILLGGVLERVAGAPLDELVAREVAAPLGLSTLDYVGTTPPPGTVAPTSRDAGETLLGRVHDRNAERLGGVAGHAGLFATGLDVARVAQAWLGGTWLDEATRARFVAVPASGRPLGWDRPEHDGREPSHFGRRTGPATIGHTGWTGTQLWIDPERDLFVVLLTNRAYAPTHRDSFRRLREVRARVADEVRGER